MKTTKSISFPTNLLFFDTETKGDNNPEMREECHHKLWFGYVIAARFEDTMPSRVITKDFKTTSEFWEIVNSRLSPERPLWLFAHNIGFDLTIVDFWNRLEKEKWKIKFIVIDDPPTIVEVQTPKGTLVCVDTLNYWRVALKTLGESLSIPKLDFPPYDAPFKQWREYCKNDVAILYEAITRLIRYLKTNDLASLKYTAPSIALDCFKHRFLKHNVFIHDNKGAISLERDSYYGGLVKTQFVGSLQGTEVYHLDFNSLYPACMMNPVPVKLVDYGTNKRPKELQKDMINKGAVARVVLNSAVRTYPLRYKDKLYDVCGRFTTTLCGPELQTALKLGNVIGVEEFALYEMAPIFASYVDYFWEQHRKAKLANDKVQSDFAKLLMNSLYGKMGQRAFEWSKLDMEIVEYIYKRHNKAVPEAYCNDSLDFGIRWGMSTWKPLDIDESFQIRSVGDQTEIKLVKGEHNESFPAIAAYVTSYGREKLKHANAIAEVKEVFYNDTDSLFVSKKGYQRLLRHGLVDANTMGKLKLEGVYLDVVLHGPKHYHANGKLKIKGVRDNAIKVGDNTYLQNQFEGLKSVLRREPCPFIKIKWVEKEYSPEVDKGILLKTGFVTPFVLNEPKGITIETLLE